MTAIFVDTSGLAKRYITETGTVWTKNLLDPTTKNEVYIVRVTTVEMVAAITRRERGGALPAPDANKARAEFRADLMADYQVIEITEALANKAMMLAEIHGLRGYDAMQLAAGLELNSLYLLGGFASILFVSADNPLNAAARIEGLTVDDPNAHP